jgi:hypothetical protein
MAIVLNCDCGRKLKVGDEMAGQEGQCPACGRVLQIPHPVEVADVPLVEAVEQPAKVEPSDEIKNHGGDPIPDDADFFVDPPQEIGPLLSAYSTLRQGKAPWPLWLRWMLGLFLFGVGAAIGLVIDILNGVHNPIWLVFWPLAFGVVGAAIALLASGFTHTCTYVGRDGVARYVCSGRRDNVGTREVFRFRDATELRTSQTMHYRNGIYQNTTYTFTWTDVGGRQRYQVGGSHTKKDGNPPTTDFYHFARAAEFAWTMYLIDDAHRQIELSGDVKFHVGKNQWIRVGPGQLTFALGGTEDKWGAEEVGAATVDQGVVKIKRTDAKEGWFSSSGVLKFSFENLANAQLFFHLLDKLLGVQVE